MLCDSVVRLCTLGSDKAPDQIDLHNRRRLSVRNHRVHPVFPDYFTPLVRRGATFPRFLPAEDDDDLRFIIVQVVSEVYPSARIAAHTPRQGCPDDFKKNAANLVISNHSMPVMDGPASVRHFRERSLDLPIVMVLGSP